MSKRQQSNGQGPKTVAEVEAFDVPGFCKAHLISPNTYYRLDAKGEGPDYIKLGKRRIIPKEAAARWREKMLRKSGAA
jgi:hypothetical protein